MASAGKAGKDGMTGERNVTKKDLVDSIVRQTGLARGDVQKVVQKVLEELIDSVRHGKRVELRDFGVFEVKARAARTAQNPKTMEPVPVPPKLAVRFKAGRLMKSALEERSKEAMLSNGSVAPVVETAAASPMPDPSSNGHAPKTLDLPPMVEIPAREPAAASSS
ncbi:MAG: integration host factor subunit beta [Phycisphaerales bacterium]|nr:integration host factor subunit beta [Phycisphaerales bacterium]